MTDWTYLKPIYLESIGQTLFMALVTLLIGGLLGLVLGIFLYATRRNGVLANRPVNLVLNVIVNIIRPIPFLVAVVTIIILVQFAQFLGNWLARRALRR